MIWLKISLFLFLNTFCKVFNLFPFIFFIKLNNLGLFLTTWLAWWNLACHWFFSFFNRRLACFWNFALYWKLWSNFCLFRSVLCRFYWLFLAQDMNGNGSLWKLMLNWRLWKLYSYWWVINNKFFEIYSFVLILYLFHIDIFVFLFRFWNVFFQIVC